MKIPFNFIMDRALKLIELSAISSSMELEIFFRREFILYLKECGWYESEFDKELLKFIDGNWDININ